LIHYFDIRHRTKRAKIVSYCLDNDKKIDFDIVCTGTVLEIYLFVIYGIVVPALGSAYALVME